MIEFTKDELTLIRHGLDMVCRTEAGGLGQTGLNGLKEGRVHVLTARLVMAADLDVRVNEEYARLDEMEKAAALEKAKEPEHKPKLVSKGE